MLPASVGLLTIVVALYGIGLGREINPETALISLTVGWMSVLTAIAPEFFVRNRRRVLDIFNPKYIVLAFLLIYVYVPLAVICSQHGYAPHLGYRVNLNSQLLAAAVVSIAGVAFGLGFNALGQSAANVPVLKYSIRSGSTSKAVILLLVVGLASRLYYLHLFGFDIGRVLELMSSTERGSELQGISQALLIGASCFDAGILLWAYKIICSEEQRNKKILKLCVLIFPAILFSFLLSSKRSNVVVLLLFPAIWLHYCGYRIAFKTGVMLSLGAAVVIPLLLLARIAIPLYQAGLDPTEYIGRTFGEVAQFYVELPEFNLADMILLTVNDSERIESIIGDKFTSFFKYSFGTLIIFIPRLVWPEKPLYEDFSYIYYQVVEGALDSQVGYAPTVVSSYFIFFGIIGSFFAFALTGHLYRRAYEYFALSGRAERIFHYSLLYWAMFLYLRFGTLAFLILLFLQNFLVLIVAGFASLRRRKVLPCD